MPAQAGSPFFNGLLPKAWKRDSVKLRYYRRTTPGRTVDFGAAPAGGNAGMSQRPIPAVSRANHRKEEVMTTDLYDANASWAQLPEGWSFTEVVAVAADSRDRVFVFSRSDHPVTIFERDGQFVGSWGEGEFVRTSRLAYRSRRQRLLLRRPRSHRSQIHGRRKATDEARRKRRGMRHGRHHHGLP